MSHFRELRLRVVETRADLRQQRDLFEQAEAQAEQAAIDAGRAGGKNAEERERSPVLALMSDPAYQGARSRLRAAEEEAERVEALLESARDERRASEWAVRLKLADALFRAGVQTDEPDASGDSAWDDTADHLLVSQVLDDDLYEIPF